MLLAAAIFCGGLLLCAVRQVNHWLDGSHINPPLLVSRFPNAASLQVILADLITLPSIAVIGCGEYRWAGAFLAPLAAWVAHSIFARVLCVNRRKARGETRLFNALYQLLILPYLVMAAAVWSLLHH